MTVSYQAVVDQALRDRITLDLVTLSARFRICERQQLGENIMIVDGDYSPGARRC